MNKFGLALLLTFFAIVGCKSDELGETPPIPVPPSEVFSQRSVCFDGNSSLSQIDAGTLFPAVALAQPINPLTVSVWVRMSSDNPSGIILGLNDDPGQYFHIAWRPDSVLEFKTIYNGDTQLMTMGVANPKAWHHVVIQFNGSAIPNERKMLYVDGVATGVNYPMELSIFAGRFFQISPVADPMSKGCLDDIGIWDRQITAAEINALYNQGSPGSYTGSPSDVDTLWLMEEDPATAVIHDEKNVFDMTFLGAPTIQSSLVDPFKDNPEDPLDNGNAGDNKGDGGSGSGPFDGGSGGYGGELGDGGSGDGGLFP